MGSTMETTKKNKSIAEPILNENISPFIAVNLTPEPSGLSYTSLSTRNELDSHTYMVVLG